MSGTAYTVDLIFKTQGGNKLQQATSGVDKLSNAAKKAQGSVTQASNNIRKFGQTSSQASQGTNQFAKGLKDLVAQLAAVTLATVGVQKSLSAAFERGTAEKRLQNLTMSTAEYEQSLRLAKIAAADFGMTQTEATKSLGDVYSRLKGVGYGLTEVNEIYRGFNTIAAQSGVAAADASGAFLQLSQALGSGKLQGDELRSILERMPQLAQAIASEMGIAAGEVRKAGADGKITGDVMYKALKKASDGSFDLTQKLTGQQMTMNEVKQRAEELSVELGNALAPAFLTAMNKLGEYALLAANAFQKLNTWAAKNSEELKKFIQVSLEVGKIVASVAIVVKAYQLWQKAVIAVAAAKAALLAMTGVGLVKIALGATAAAATYGVMSAGIGKAEEGIKALEAESKKELETTRAKAAANSELFKGMEEGGKKQVDLAKQQKEEAKKLAEAQKQVTKNIQESGEAIERAYEAQESASDLMFQISQQRLSVESQLTSNLLDQAQAQLDNARNAGEREQAAKKVYELTIQQAELEREMAKASVVESIRKAEAQLQMLMLKEKEVQIEVNLAAANKTLNASHMKALQLAGEATFQASEQLKLKKELASAQYAEIDAIFKGKEATAKMAYEQNRVFDATKRSASEAGKFASQMERAAVAAQKASKSSFSPGQKSTTKMGFNGSQEAVNAVLGTHYRNISMQDDNGDWHLDLQNQFVKNAGVNSTTRRQNEIQQAIKDMEDQLDPNNAYNRRNQQLAEQNNAWTAQGQSGGNVSVNYNGDRINMNNDDYVKTSDVSGIVQSAVGAMQNKMTRSSKSRLAMGLT